jgi:predicted metal-binding protein
MNLQADRPVTLTVCETCGYDANNPNAPRPGATLAHLFENHTPADVRVERTRCLMSCERPCALALQSPEKYSYVLCDLPADLATIEALTTFCEHYATSESGIVAWKHWPDEIKGRFAARIPWLA